MNGVDIRLYIAYTNAWGSLWGELSATIDLQTSFHTWQYHKHSSREPAQEVDDLQLYELKNKLHRIMTSVSK